MKVRYFAWLKDITKTDVEEINHKSIKNVETLKKYICIKHPKLKKYFYEKDIIRISINLNYSNKNNIILADDEIALFPPVSGG